MSSRPRSVSRSLALLCTALLAACASGGRPRLQAIAPDSVQLIPGNVIEVDLRGSSFDRTSGDPQNVVRVGPVLLRAVPSRSNGTLIRIALPDAVPSGGEAPPAPWLSGRYPVTITTSRGTSDTLMLTISAGPGGRP
jgi:hypothetical protein